MKKKVATILVLGVVMMSLVGCGQSWERTKKNMASEYGGGLNRTVTVYDQKGEHY